MKLIWSQTFGDDGGQLCNQAAAEVNPQFESVFNHLRRILEPHATRLQLTANTADHYCLEVGYSPKLKKAFPAAWVKIGKNYVSYHFMPVYMFPKLRDSMSEKLRARMQGKSCFNFKVLDETLFKELERVTTEGFAMCRKAGFAPESSAA